MLLTALPAEDTSSPTPLIVLQPVKIKVSNSEVARIFFHDYLQYTLDSLF